MSTLYEFQIHMLSPSSFDCILHCSKALLNQLSLSRVVEHKTPGLCCKTSPLQEAVPKGEVEEIQRIIEPEFITRVHLCPRYFSELLLVWTRERVRSSLRVRKSLAYRSPKSYQNMYGSVTMKCFLFREKSEQSSAWHHLYRCAGRYPPTYITVLFVFIHSSALLNITTQLKAAAVSLCSCKYINGLVDFPHPSLPILSLCPRQVKMTPDSKC